MAKYQKLEDTLVSFVCDKRSWSEQKRKTRITYQAAKFGDTEMCSIASSQQGFLTNALTSLALKPNNKFRTVTTTSVKTVCCSSPQHDQQQPPRYQINITCLSIYGLRCITSPRDMFFYDLCRCGWLLFLGDSISLEFFFFFNFFSS